MMKGVVHPRVIIIYNKYITHLHPATTTKHKGPGGDLDAHRGCNHFNRLRVELQRPRFNNEEP